MTPTGDHHATAATLSLDTLADVPADIATPTYSRGSLSAGIVHIGPGNFHRAHQAVYLDALMNADEAHDWAIVGVSVMPGDASLRERLLKQDCLTTVVSQSSAASRAHVTGCMIDYLPVGDIPVLLDAMSDPAIRIVSLTVTEGGYFLNADTGRFDPDHPAIQAEASAAEPGTVFGLIVRALERRRAAGTPAFTVMSCDNLPHNGVIVREAVVGTARLIDAELADWIDRESRFPNAMVDRITPATGPRELALIAEVHGIADAAPVFCEDFKQWVIEDDFACGRPALEMVGVQFVADVTPFETMKIRVLNGGHALMAYPAALLDIEFANSAVEHPLIRPYLEKVERDEVVPTIPPVPDTDVSVYLQSVLSRFTNPAIGDTVQRLCFDGSNRQPKFILPTLSARLQDNAGIQGLALGSAFWCRYCAGTSESGREFAPNDGAHEQLHTAAMAARDRPAAWLEQHEIYGALGSNTTFINAFTQALNMIWQQGTEATLADYAAD